MPSADRPEGFVQDAQQSVDIAKKPEERFGTYDEFIMALTSARSLLLVQTFRNSQGPQDSGHGRSWWKR
jgi:hypothetical protein